MKKNTVILLAGGVGARMRTGTPKQFLPIQNKLVARYSFDIIMGMPEIAEVIIVCAPPFRSYFETDNKKIPIKFALPGERRQDSVYNGFQAAEKTSKLIVVHDSARPVLTVELMRRVMEAGHEHGAATVGMPVKFTVKETDSMSFVKHTHDRAKLWEIQTPQAVKPEILRQGFKKAIEENITVTDDVSLAELVGHKVKIVQGCYSNIKITTQEDLAMAEQLLSAVKGR